MKYEAFYVAAYAVPAALVWAVLGCLFWIIGAVVWFLPIIAFGYASFFGFIESFGIPFRRFESKWQVPASWIKGRPSATQALIWGSLLGPGFVTRNPYAGIWLLPPLVGSHQNLGGAIIAGFLIGVTHGVSRATGVLRNRQYLGLNSAALRILGARLRWQLADGIALLVGTGLLLPYCLWLMGVHV